MQFKLNILKFLRENFRPWLFKPKNTFPNFLKYWIFNVCVSYFAYIYLALLHIKLNSPHFKFYRFKNVHTIYLCALKILFYIHTYIYIYSNDFIYFKRCLIHHNFSIKKSTANMKNRFLNFIQQWQQSSSNINNKTFCVTKYTSTQTHTYVYLQILNHKYIQTHQT